MDLYVINRAPCHQLLNGLRDDALSRRNRGGAEVRKQGEMLVSSQLAAGCQGADR
jgi:hypothetical protein